MGILPLLWQENKGGGVMNVFERIKEKCVYEPKIGRASLEAFLKILKDVEKEYGKGGWIPCSSGNMPKCGEFDVKKVWATMHRKEVDFYFTKRLNWNNCYKRWEWLNGKELAEEWEVVAWMYVEVPEPYKGVRNG
jgi:hypothetical protein